MKQCLTFMVAFHALSAFAKPTVAVAKFEDKVAAGGCGIHKSRQFDPTADMQRQLINIFVNSPDLRVMNSGQLTKGPAPRYLVAGTLRQYDKCRVANPKNQKIKVAI